MPEEIECRVLYRDALMIVLDKPAGVAVHRGPKGGACLEDGFEALRFGLPRRPALAHRLDRETSGCLVLGRHRQALVRLGALFKHGEVSKTYWAVVEGGPEAECGRIDLALGRLDPTRGWWMKSDPHGRSAVTLWCVLGRQPGNEGAGESGADRGLPPVQRPGTLTPVVKDAPRAANAPKLTWLALTPLTGRTHQLRVHCAEMGWPIVGDAIYGSAPRDGGPGLQLHAVKVVVPLYPKREPIVITAPVPQHLRERLTACGWQQPTRAI
jgi:tRNA pseudouridine32 synthase / 23S rRNA pseudouridine746 synthase